MAGADGPVIAYRTEKIESPLELDHRLVLAVVKASTWYEIVRNMVSGTTRRNA